MLRNAISAFHTRLRRAMACGVVRCWSGVHEFGAVMGPGSAQQRKERCTASGTRD